MCHCRSTTKRDDDQPDALQAPARGVTIATDNSRLVSSLDERSRLKRTGYIHPIFVRRKPLGIAQARRDFIVGFKNGARAQPAPGTSRHFSITQNSVAVGAWPELSTTPAFPNF
jgi:hypothetical protein